MTWWAAYSARVSSLNTVELAAYIALPVVELVMIWVWLNVIWPISKEKAPKSQDAPDLGDLMRGVERFFRKANNVRVARGFRATVGGAVLYLKEDQRGHVVADKDTSAELGDRDVYVVFECPEQPEGTTSGMVLITKSLSTNLDVTEDDLSYLAKGHATETTALVGAKKSAKVMGAGDEGGYYDAHWTDTFDLQFLIIMVAYIALLIGFTYFIPITDNLSGFLLHQLPKLGIMVLVSFLGGLLARQYCEADERGYLMSPVSVDGQKTWFKVNYTRKIQHFAAYIIPLVMTNPDVSGSSPIQKMIVTAWADWFTLLGFLVLIGPMRELGYDRKAAEKGEPQQANCIGKFFMTQFNSLDRPEDRPHTLDWIILGNILPGLVLILFFNWLYAVVGLNSGLTMIFVLVAGVGDGLAEPVGVYLGNHKYRTSGCGDEGVKYTRSLEGSACVYWTTLLFVCQYVHAFPNMLAFWVAAVVMPPLMTYGEAYAPHTLDTPVLMGLGGFTLLAIAILCDPDKMQELVAMV